MDPPATTTPAGERRAAAGRCGDEVRSDLRVEIELRDDGGLDLELKSRVEPYYGDAIRTQVREVLRTLGVHHALITVEDEGALPYVIAARVEAAVRRAGGPAERDARPERTAPAGPRSSRERMRRSRLYLPGNEPKYFINAGLHDPDGVILDLEDSVHSGEKDAARLLVRNALRAVDFHGAERMVRINQLPLGLADLESILPEEPDLILIPKVEAPETIAEVVAALRRICGPREEHLPWLMPIVESALGVERAFEIARASERIAALTIGLEDYAADLGVMKSSSGRESLYGRQRVVNAARAAGVQAIDSVYGQVDDTRGLRRWGALSRRMGFTGMGCVHPGQIRTIHEAFNPTPAEIERAQRIVAAFEHAKAAGLGVTSLGSKMIDPPVIRQAQLVVDRAEGLGLLSGTDSPTEIA